MLPARLEEIPECNVKFVRPLRIVKIFLVLLLASEDNGGDAGRAKDKDYPCIHRPQDDYEADEGYHILQYGYDRWHTFGNAFTRVGLDKTNLVLEIIVVFQILIFYRTGAAQNIFTVELLYLLFSLTNV